MKTILLVCPTSRDKREIEKAVDSEYRVIFYEYDDLALEKVVSSKLKAKPTIQALSFRVLIGSCDFSFQK